MSKLTIKQFVPIPADFSVFERHEEEGKRIWHDYSRDGTCYFWGLVDGGEDDDQIQLFSVETIDGNMQPEYDCIVAPRDRCPECGSDVAPEIAPTKGSFLRYVCPNCGHGLPVRPIY